MIYALTIDAPSENEAEVTTVLEKSFQMLPSSAEWLLESKWNFSEVEEKDG